MHDDDDRKFKLKLGLTFIAFACVFPVFMLVLSLLGLID